MRAVGLQNETIESETPPILEAIREVYCSKRLLEQSY